MVIMHFGITLIGFNCSVIYFRIWFLKHSTVHLLKLMHLLTVQVLNDSVFVNVFEIVHTCHDALEQ